MRERTAFEDVMRAEDFAVPMAAPNFTVDKTGVVTEQGNGPNPDDMTSLAVPGMPSLPSGMRYVEPTLQAASADRATPYYAAYTNDGDLAATTYAADGQGVRLIDPKTGSVLYQGAGPDAAKYATGLANALSEDKGRKAAWAIQIDDGGDAWRTTGYDRKDPKNNFLGKLADFALPALGALLMPVTGGLSAGLAAGLGAAGGSAASSLAQGRGLKDTLLRAGISGLSAGVVGPAVGKATSGLTGAASGATGSPGFVNFLNTPGSLADGIAGIAGNTIAPLTVTAAGSALPGALGAAGGALMGGAASDALTGNAGGDTVGQPTDVSEVVVTAANKGMSVEQIAALTGLSAAAVGAMISAGGSAATAAPGPVNLVNTPASISPNITPSTLQEAIAQGKVGEWATAHPLDAARLGLGVASAAGALLGGTKSSGGGGAINSNAGKPASLNPVFSATLPAPNLAVNTPRDMSGVDWKRYGMGPEQSFFTGVPQRPGYAQGGSFAVQGMGDGRSDSVPADLSDGEYVIDAETVALLGNGSNNAGADALDRFRANVRQHKGRQLAEGRFSVDAKSPEAYMRAR